MYTIRTVQKLTGIAAGTIRSWENRYQVVNPIRSDGGHRLYTDEDVDDLIWIKLQMAEKGLNISQAALMLKQRKEFLQVPLLASNLAESSLDGIEASYLGILTQLYDTLLEMDLEKANRIVDLGFSMFEFEGMLHHVLVPLMIRVGDEWEQGTISVADEHLVSQFVQQRLMQFMRLFPVTSRLPSVLAACPEGEHHQIGLLLFSLFLRRKGFEVIYLGANTPVEGIYRLIKLKKSDILCLSLLDPKRVEVHMAYIDCVLEQCPHIKIVLGGKGYNALPPQHDYRSFIIGENLESWESWYKQFI